MKTISKIIAIALVISVASICRVNAQDVQNKQIKKTGKIINSQKQIKAISVKQSDDKKAPSDVNSGIATPKKSTVTSDRKFPKTDLSKVKASKINAPKNKIKSPEKKVDNGVKVKQDENKK